MQPRQGVEVPKESPAEVSGVEVQPEVPKEAVLEGVGGDSEGEGLALESVQNLESKPQKEVDAAENPENGVIVAQTGDSASLEEQLQRSAEGGVPAELAGLEPTTWPTYGGIERGPAPADINKTLPLAPDDPRNFGGVEVIRTISFEEAEKIKKQYVIGVDCAAGEDHGAAAVVRLGANGAADELVEMLDLKPIGELATGEYRATVRLAEGYVEGAKQQAEADGISLEDWLTLQLNAYLEQWWMAPGPR
jgi:hypothetical protein